MKKKLEKLNDTTPDWFKDWHDKAFWHFTIEVEDKLALHDKFLWIIITAIVGLAIAVLLRGIS